MQLSGYQKPLPWGVRKLRTKRVINHYTHPVT